MTRRERALGSMPKIHFEVGEVSPAPSSLWFGTPAKGKRTLSSRRWRALCRNISFWERRTHLTKDVMRVTCQTCRKNERCRIPLLLLLPDIRAHVAVLLDWLVDHPADRHPPAGLSLSLLGWGFPVGLAVDMPKRVLRMLVTAQARVDKLGQDRCNEASRGLS